MGACSPVTPHLSSFPLPLPRGGSSADTPLILIRCEAIPEDALSAPPRSLLFLFGSNFSEVIGVQLLLHEQVIAGTPVSRSSSAVWFIFSSHLML